MSKHKVGNVVSFQSYNWFTNLQGEITGVVTRVSPNGLEVYSCQGTRILQAEETRTVPKRSEAEVMSQIADAYGGLSPENLTCDGELNATQVRRRAAQLHRALKALFIELGREVTESEAYGEKPLPGEVIPGTRRSSPAKSSGFKVGDKVTFTAKGQTFVGHVQRISQKTISVRPEGQTKSYWRVSPHLLQAV